MDWLEYYTPVKSDLGLTHEYYQKLQENYSLQFAVPSRMFQHFWTYLLWQINPNLSVCYLEKNPPKDFSVQIFKLEDQKNIYSFGCGFEHTSSKQWIYADLLHLVLSYFVTNQLEPVITLMDEKPDYAHCRQTELIPLLGDEFPYQRSREYLPLLFY